MTPEILLYHLRELGVSVTLTEDVRSLELEAAEGVLTLELMEIVKSFRDDLVEMVYLEEEQTAIQEEGCDGERRYDRVAMKGDRDLLERFRMHPAVTTLRDELNKRGGGVIEVTQCAA